MLHGVPTRLVDRSHAPVLLEQSVPTSATVGANGAATVSAKCRQHKSRALTLVRCQLVRQAVPTEAQQFSADRATASANSQRQRPMPTVQESALKSKSPC